MAFIQDRLAAGLSRRSFIGGVAGTVAAAAARPAGAVVPERPGKAVQIGNVRLFDGRSDALRAGQRVVVRGATIEAIEPDTAPSSPDRLAIDGGGRVLMPGLIDAHWHAMLAAMPQTVAMTADVGYLHLAAAAEAERTLMRGVTTVRDMGGPTFALKRAIDEGLAAGPRIYPSGAMISQTSGHGDFRLPYEAPRTPASALSRAEALGASAIADGVPEMLRRTREQLMAGASQIKVMAGGGVSSPYDPLDAVQFTPDELAAAVQAAADWNTYVAVHVYMPKGIQRAIAAGVRCIEHGHLADDESARMMADHGVWWSLQPFLDDIDAFQYPGPEQQAKLARVNAGTDAAYGLAKKHGVRLAWGTDALFDRKLAGRQTAQLAKLTRWFTPAETVRMATGGNAALLAMSGPRNPYPAPLGVIAPGAYADLLLVDGDPTADPAVLADAAGNLRLIMKDGRIFKNTL